ncbi:class A beta-lactamase [Chamaesiphon sp.]|uniref:class A beta-lactamase n=1 Tax=Chamaesiphon sp. TaxID=2814140 RepID=UPI0035933D90
MNHSRNRRKLLLAAVSVPMATIWTSWASHGDAAAAGAQLAKLERTLAGRLGVFALNTANGKQLSYRGDEYFPMCSTFKVVLASAILKRSTQIDGLMQQRIEYQQSDLVTYSPITEQYVEDGMTVTALCAAAIQYSDNTASNLLMQILGGPGAVTTFARSIGDRQFQLDRWETALNSSIPGDRRDTSTPNAMASSLQRLALGNALEPPLQLQLRVWLQGNTTGAARIRAGVPADWQVGDKTGTGDYGTANDVALLWPPRRAPVVVAIYTTQGEKDAKACNDIVASAARIVVDWLG